jgi:hypothetical protein
MRSASDKGGSAGLEEAATGERVARGLYLSAEESLDFCAAAGARLSKRAISSFN